jgi:hypothetical protein
MPNWVVASHATTQVIVERSKNLVALHWAHFVAPEESLKASAQFVGKEAAAVQAAVQAAAR